MRFLRFKKNGGKEYGVMRFNVSNSAETQCGNAERKRTTMKFLLAMAKKL